MEKIELIEIIVSANLISILLYLLGQNIYYTIYELAIRLKEKSKKGERKK